MRDIYEVLKEKEDALKRVRREVETLRSAWPLLLDEDDSTRKTVSPGMERKENVVTSSADETAALIAQIRARFVAAPAPRITDIKESQKSLLLQFRQRALDASHTLLRRVRDSRLLEGEFQRKTVRDLFEWLRPSNAA